MTAVLVALLAVLLALPGTAAAHGTPQPGAPGTGDRLFPLLGNGGYDAKHYDLALHYGSTAPEQDVAGKVTMVARATQSLSRFDLDFAGDAVAGVRVDGRPAAFARDGDELVITPRRPIWDGRRFTVSVRFVSGPFTPVDDLPTGWFTTVDGSVVGAQPDAAHTIFPVNDTPADKATYAIRLDVPEGVTAVANGERRGSTYVMREPMAAELIQLAVGDLRVVERGSASGVRVRDVVPTALAARLDPQLVNSGRHIDWLVDRVGRYPFDSYGVLAANREFGYALETQTLSLFPEFVFEAAYPAARREPIMVHELAHQWFGDSVAPKVWSDLWLNEGHATWYEWLYGAEFFPTQEGYDFVPRVKEAYSHGDQWRAAYGPVARPSHNDWDLFSPTVYDGGAVVLYALRQVIGADDFDRLERRWAQRYAGRSVTTEDFIALASRVSGRELGPFLRRWLYGTTQPQMPGHPDWTVLPADTPLSTARAARVREASIRLVRAR